MCAMRAALLVLLAATAGARLTGDNEEGKAFLKANAKKEGVFTTSTGLQYKVLKKGDGLFHPAVDAQCSVHYEGRTVAEYPSGKFFDSSYQRKKPGSFAPNQVIPGWTEAMKMMVEGDKWELYVPADLAYGENGRGKDIGPGDVLVFTVELLTIRGKKTDKNGNAVPDQQGASPLHDAAAMGRIQYVKDLLASGDVELEKKGEKGETALHMACVHGDHDIVDSLLKAGANVNAAMDEGVMPLHIVASNGKTLAVRVLIAGGASLEATTNEKMTAFMHAASNGHTDAMESLLERGANKFAKDDVGRTSMHAAASKGHHVAVTWLAEHGLDVNEVAENGMQPIHYAAAGGSGRTVVELLKAGANVDARDDDGLTAWLVAAASGAKDVIVALVSNENGKREYPKADVEVTDPMKMNAVHLAALGGFTETIKMLTGPGWGIPIDARAAQNFTALHVAAIQGHDETVIELLDLGADLTAEDAGGRTALDMAGPEVRAAFAKWRKKQERLKAEGEEEDFLAGMVDDDEEEGQADAKGKSKEEL